MINEFIFVEEHDWDEIKIVRCCPEPPRTPPTPTGPDCGYNTWDWELKKVTWELKEVTSELTHVQKHLGVVTIRYNRLKQWHDELTAANELAFKICRQLEIIEAQLINICRNTKCTVKAIEILYCMVREFYEVVDGLHGKWDRLMNCIKCMNNPALTPTQGIGKYLTDYGTALTTVITTRTTLIPLLMTSIDSAIKLHREICDHYGYRKLIKLWQETLHCGIPCEKEGHPHHHPHPEPLPLARNVRQEKPLGEPEGAEGPEEVFCLEPIFHFPICNDPYYQEILELYEVEKEDVHILTRESNELTKKQLALTACQQSLNKALKEVTPS
jgi:hypothetical protein